MIALLMAVLLVAADPAPSTAEPPDDPGLPAGELLGVSASREGAFFIVQDSVQRSGPVIDYWVYVAYTPGVDLGEGAVMVQGMDHQSIDCDAREFTRLASFAYDDAGKQISWLPAEPPVKIEPGFSYAFQAKVLCDGAEMPTQNYVQGSKAALTIARAIAK